MQNLAVYPDSCSSAQTVLRWNDRRGTTRPSFRSILQPCLKSCSYESTPIFGLMPASSAFNLRNSSHKQIQTFPKLLLTFRLILSANKIFVILLQKQLLLTHASKEISRFNYLFHKNDLFNYCSYCLTENQ